jgi:hypothetical protein
MSIEGDNFLENAISIFKSQNNSTLKYHKLGSMVLSRHLFFSNIMQFFSLYERWQNDKDHLTILKKILVNKIKNLLDKVMEYIR